MHILGLKEVSYISKKGFQVDGVELHCTTMQERVDGTAVERIYISRSVLGQCDEVHIGDEVTVLYNKYGKIEKIEHVG